MQNAGVRKPVWNSGFPFDPYCVTSCFHIYTYFFGCFYNLSFSYFFFSFSSLLSFLNHSLPRSTVKKTAEVICILWIIFTAWNGWRLDWYCAGLGKCICRLSSRLIDRTSDFLLSWLHTYIHTHKYTRWLKVHILQLNKYHQIMNEQLDAVLLNYA